MSNSVKDHWMNFHRNRLKDSNFKDQYEILEWRTRYVDDKPIIEYLFECHSELHDKPHRFWHSRPEHIYVRGDNCPLCKKTKLWAKWTVKVKAVYGDDHNIMNLYVYKNNNYVKILGPNGTFDELRIDLKTKYINL